nr:dormancy-associated protein 2-like isoform X3 [Nicotiana tomentosiformis]
MGSKVFMLIVLAILLVIISEVAARELAESPTNSMDKAKVFDEKNDHVNDAKDLEFGGFGGRIGGGYGGNPGGGNGGFGGYPGGGYGGNPGAAMVVLEVIRVEDMVETLAAAIVVTEVIEEEDMVDFLTTNY